jgi:hypothetical protein
VWLHRPARLHRPTSPAGQSFDPKIKSDLRELCQGIRDTQNEIDNINSHLGRYSNFWSADFRYRSGLYFC